MNCKHDIHDVDDIRSLVYTFYDKIRADEFIGSIFNEKIQDRWPQHLEKMVCFWQTVLLEEHTYYGSPFPPHANLPVGHAHFQHWLALFFQTVQELFTGKKADEALWRANKMAEMFEIKIGYFKTQKIKPLV